MITVRQVRRRLPRLILLLLGFSLPALLVADLMQAARPSGLTALACTARLFHRKPDAQQLVARYHDTIANQAMLQNLPGELVAAVIVDHQKQLSPYRDFTDCFGSALGANLSLGLAQMRISTAARIDGKSLENLSASGYRNLRARLLNPELNIAYEARELRALRDRAIRYPGMSAQTLIHDPAAMALLVTEYRMGRLPTAIENSRLSGNAFTTLSLMQDGTLDRFGRDADDTLRVQTTIREYLGYVYCQSGIFNEDACSHWRQSQTQSTP